MALRFERRHLPFRTWYHKRLGTGAQTAAPVGAFCLLLCSDPGTDNKEVLLTTDPGNDTKCVQLTTTTVP